MKKKKRLYRNPYSEEVKETAKAWNKHARHQKSSMQIDQDTVARLFKAGYTPEEILDASTATELKRLLCTIESQEKALSD